MPTNIFLIRPNFFLIHEFSSVFYDVITERTYLFTASLTINVTTLPGQLFCKLVFQVKCTCYSLHFTCFSVKGCFFYAQLLFGLTIKYCCKSIHVLIRSMESKMCKKGLSENNISDMLECFLTKILSLINGPHSLQNWNQSYKRTLVSIGWKKTNLVIFHYLIEINL